MKGDRARCEELAGHFSLPEPRLGHQFICMFTVSPYEHTCSSAIITVAWRISTQLNTLTLTTGKPMNIVLFRLYSYPPPAHERVVTIFQLPAAESLSINLMVVT
jgi:hypothetical protein